MRRLVQIGAHALAVAIAAAPCSAECVEVTVAPQAVLSSLLLPDYLALIPFFSSREVTLAVVDNGKPAGAKVEFYLIGSGGRAETPTLTVISDQFGRIKSPKLPDGLYEIIATAEPELQADLLLEISSHYGKKATAFRMELRPGPVDPRFVTPQLVTLPLPQPVMLPEPVTIPQVAIENHLQVFRGTVTDQSGAVVPGASIRIFRQGTAKFMQELKSGTSGDFETELAPGTYVAQFSYPGFAPKPVGFEIVSSGSERLIVTLKIGSC